jgi:hypothetical protein
MNTNDKKGAKRRYNLHYKIRKQGFKLKCKEKTIIARHNQAVNSKQVARLVNEFNYVIQKSIC